MKQILFIALLVGLVFTGQALAQTPTKKAVAFERYDTSYFIKADTVQDGEFLLIATQGDFDAIFGAAARMNNNKFLPKDFFDNNLILVTAKIGGPLRKYEVKQVAESNGKLYISFNTADGKPSSASFNSFMSVGVPRGDYEEVVLVQNGKKVSTMPVPEQ